MIGIEGIALMLGIVNGALLVLKPAARFHSRIDVLEVKLSQLQQSVGRIERRLDDERD